MSCPNPILGATSPPVVIKSQLFLLIPLVGSPEICRNKLDNLVFHSLSMTDTKFKNTLKQILRSIPNENWRLCFFVLRILCGGRQKQVVYLLYISWTERESIEEGGVSWAELTSILPSLPLLCFFARRTSKEHQLSFLPFFCFFASSIANSARSFSQQGIQPTVKRVTRSSLRGI